MAAFLAAAAPAAISAASSIFQNRSNKDRMVSTRSKMGNDALKKYFQKGIETTPLYGAGSEYLQSLLSNEPGAFDAFEAPYRRQYEQETIPGLVQRFAGMGTGAGALSSSALQNSLGRAGVDLNTNLASLRSGLQMQALPQALAYAQQPYTNVLGGIQADQQAYQPGQPSGAQSIFQGLTGAISQGIGQYGGNWAGSKIFGPQYAPQAGTPGGIG